MLEGEYLELVNQLKEQHEEKNREVDKIKEQFKDCKKALMSAFGMVRVLDEMLRGTEVEEEIVILVSVLRTFLSYRYDEFIDV
jgi:hypothetical protein